MRESHHFSIGLRCGETQLPVASRLVDQSENSVQPSPVGLREEQAAQLQGILGSRLLTLHQLWRGGGGGGRGEGGRKGR